MKISQKLILSFLLVASLASATTFFTLRSYNKIDHTFTKLMDDSTRTVEILNGLKTSGEQIISSSAEISFDSTDVGPLAKVELDKEIEQLSEAGYQGFDARINDYNEMVGTIAPEDANMLEGIRSSGHNLIETSKDIVDLKKQNIGGIQLRAKRRELEANEATFLRYVNDALAVQSAEEVAERENVKASIDLATRQTLIITVLTFMLATFSGFYISFLTLRRIRRLKEASEKVGNGKLDIEINVNSRDEIGDLARSFNQMVGDLKRNSTERKRADAEIQDSHRRVEDIVNSVEGIVWEADAQTFVFSFVSAQAEQILGYPSQLWIDEPTFWSEHIHPDDRDVAVKFCVDSTQKLLPHEFEYRMLARDGRDVWLKDTVTVLSENGRPTMLRGIMMDITEQKRTEAALEESDASFKALFDTASDAIFVTKGGEFQACNPAAEKLFGCTREDMLSRRSAGDFSPLRQPDGRLSSEKAGELKAAAMIGEPQFFEWTHIRLDGTPFDAEVNLTRVEVGGTTQVQATVRDITHRKQVEEETRRLNSEIETHRERLETIIANVQGVVWETKTRIEQGETSLRFDFVSDYIETMLGFSVSECLATPNFWLDIIHPEDRKTTEQRVRAIFAAGKGGTVEFRWIARDGHEVWIESRNTIVHDDTGKAVGLRGIAVDITERKSLEEQLTYQALHDPLTRLGNRVLFRDRVEHAVNRTARKHTPIAVLFLDLDNFKSVNDSLGHEAGDKLLISVTERLQACLRVSDTPARFGGDEFAILLEDLAHTDQVGFIAERIRSVLCAPFSIDGTEVFIGSSIGIAITIDGRETPEELLCNADVAMYMSKSNGKNCYTVFENEMRDVVVKRVRLESDMRAAIDNGEFEVYYQPILDLLSEKIMGMEALVRWNHPKDGLIPPLDFIPLAEETGLIVPLGRWIMEEACTQARKWQNRYEYGDALSITVNVASRQFRDDSLEEMIMRALEKSQLPPKSLILEITESTMLSDTESTIKKLNDLKKLGIRFAIDDFGTGYSSLSYLQRFPVDILKIDKSFVDTIAMNKEGAAVAKAIITMSETLNLKTIAEGIESGGQQTQLQNLGCELGQGYHFAKPLEAAKMAEFLRRSLLSPDINLPILSTKSSRLAKKLAVTV